MQGESSRHRPVVELKENTAYKLVHDQLQRFSAAKVLELGCAEGAFSEHVKELGHAVMGVELNADSAEVARDRGIDVICHDVTDAQCWDLSLIHI